MLVLNFLRCIVGNPRHHLSDVCWNMHEQHFLFLDDDDGGDSVHGNDDGDDDGDDGHLLSDACWTMTWWCWWWWSPCLTCVEICTRFADSLDKVDTNEKSKHNSNTEQITNFLSTQLELNTGLQLSGNLAASAGVAQVEICTKACSFYWESLHILKEQTELFWQNLKL